MNSHDNQWPFEDPEDVAVFTIKDILEKKKPVLYVSHDIEDGYWQFLSDGVALEIDARVISLLEMAQLDSTIMELADLPLGWKASRIDIHSPWQKSKK